VDYSSLMTRSDSGRLSVSHSAFRAAAWFALLTLPAALAAYWRIFSGFAGWDDEGTMMMTVRQYLAGSKLYLEIFSGYGPVYYFFNGVVRRLTGVPLDHNSVRVTSAAMAMACCLICAWVVWRLTRSLAAAAVTHLLVFRACRVLHQRAWASAGVVRAAIGGSGRRRGGGVESKVSRVGHGRLWRAGSRAAVDQGEHRDLRGGGGGGGGVVGSAAPGGSGRRGRYAAGAAALVLPFALMRAHLDDPAAQAYCCVVTAADSGAAGGSVPVSHDGTSWRDAWMALAGFAAVFAIALAILAAQRVPLSSALYMLVLQKFRINVSMKLWYKRHRVEPVLDCLGPGWLAAALRFRAPCGAATRGSGSGLRVSGLASERWRWRWAC
jgi:hypothetical protein